jgi:hypothetical protein
MPGAVRPIQAAVDAIGVEPTLLVTEQVTRHGLPPPR